MQNNYVILLLTLIKMYTTKTILKFLKQNNSYLFNVHAHLSIILRNFSAVEVTHSKENKLVLNEFTIPKMNIGRNQARLTKAINALKLYISNQLPDLSPLVVQDLIELLSNLEQFYHNNPAEFVQTCKMLSNWFKVNILRVHRQQDAIPNLYWNKYSSCPVLLTNLFSRIANTHDGIAIRSIIRMIFSILEIYSVVVTPKEPNLSTITDPFRGKMEVLNSINIPRALERLGVNIEQWQQEFKLANIDAQWHTSSAHGPNGQALWMSHIDAKALYYDKELLSTFEKMANLVGRSVLVEQLSDTVHLPQFFKLTDGVPSHSKLHVIFEKGDKARIIAIGDYWTQEVLTPLHKLIAKILGGLRMDGTFNQDKIAEQVRNWTRIEGIRLYSLDLSAATDRLPITLQSKILDFLTGIEEFGETWRKLLVERDFTLKGLEPIRYQTGQPMGFKSSFVMLGLTHHIIVQEASARAGFDNFEDYVILGDDIVIANTAVAEQYKLIMSGLGLDISPFKTIEADTTFVSPIAEICKRVFWKGVEISPLPMKLLVTAIENSDMLYQLQEELSKRSLINDRLTLHYFLGGISNKIGYKELAKLNGLPSFMTGLKDPIMVNELSSFDWRTWQKTRGVSELTLQSYFTFTVMVEQLKRLGVILQNTENIYKTLIKAANVSKSVGISSKLDQYMPIEEFTQDDLDEWEVIRPFHPAMEVVKGEVDRINKLLNKISMAGSSEMMVLLLNEVVDSLKISSFEYTPDKDFAQAKATRKLVDDTLKNIQRSFINGSLNKTTQLSFSIKLDRINAIWNLKVDIDTPIIINRNVSQIASSNSQAIQRVNNFMSEGIFDDFLINKAKQMGR
nr:MAG: RNA-dependent RNA polymerase [Hangzhou mito-like virus 6]